MDGQSFKKLLLGTPDGQTVDWRTEFLIEHSGEVQSVIPDCPNLDNQQVSVSIRWVHVSTSLFTVRCAQVFF
jgi:hypothetical protein